MTTYTISVLGASGRIGTTLSKELLSSSFKDNIKIKVKVIGRDLNNLKELVNLGGEPVIIKDNSDTDGLAKSFNNSNVIFLILVPNYIPDSPDFRQFQHDQVDLIVSALKRSHGFQHLVVLSSWGADKDSGTGPVEGLHYFENQLNTNFKDKVKSITHLRVSYFIENLIPIIKSVKENTTINDTVSTPFTPDVKLPLISTNDIGLFTSNLIKDIINNGQQQQQQQYNNGTIKAIEVQGSEDLSMTQVTKLLSTHYNKPNLKYKQQSLSDFGSDLSKAGVSNNVIDLMKEVYQSINSGHLKNQLPRSNENTTETTFNSFLNSYDK